MPEVVILSPHLDDAVIDCWYVISEGNATVMNVFAGIPEVGISRFWDRICGEADSNKMMQLRRQENETALSLSGSSRPQIYLDFLDNQYRSANPTIDQLVKEILAKSVSKCSFLAPLANSRVVKHPDHVLLREVGIELHKRGHKVGFYPDSPYMNLPRNRTSRFIERFHESAQKCLGLEIDVKINELTPAQSDLKYDALRSYKTQYKMTNLESFGGLKRAAKRGYEVILETKPGHQ